MLTTTPPRIAEPEYVCDPLQWKVKHTGKFENEFDFLETLLISAGIPSDNIKEFLHPTKSNVLDPFTMPNMEHAVNLVHNHIKKNSKILVRVDCDVDGNSSASTLIQFLRAINPKLDCTYVLNYEKHHGLDYKDLSQYKKNDFGLIIVPDASTTVQEIRNIKANYTVDILILDHHLIPYEYFNENTGHWEAIDEVEASKQLDENRHNIYHSDYNGELDCYANYCTVVNCTASAPNKPGVPVYGNPELSGVGVVQKFIEAYLKKYGDEDSLDMGLEDAFADLVSLGIIADSMSMISLENRYYAMRGMFARLCRNEFINEIVARKASDMPEGRTIASMGWCVAPLINATIRYGSPEEQTNMFEALLGTQKEIEYQPRRKHKEDPKPPVEIHTLQQTMARICDNVKARQDTQVRNFVKDLEVQIKQKNLDKNSILFIDGSEVVSTNTVSGLIAGKLTNKYFRPVVLMRDRDATTYGGSGRNYNQGNIEDLSAFLQKAGVICMGHANAFGVNIPKHDLPNIIKRCNEMMPLNKLCTVYQVDWEIPAENLRINQVADVAQNSSIWGNNVPEPTFAITKIHIKASDIHGAGANNNFISFKYNGIEFIKKYCTHEEYDKITQKSRKTFGANTKNLEINVIAQFVNEKNGVTGATTPAIKIIEFDSKEYIPVESDTKKKKVSYEDEKAVKEYANNIEENFDNKIHSKAEGFESFIKPSKIQGHDLNITTSVVKPVTKTKLDLYDFDW